MKTSMMPLVKSLKKFPMCPLSVRMPLTKAMEAAKPVMGARYIKPIRTKVCEKYDSWRGDE